MSDYTKTTNFTAKDSLPAGNPSKKILGSLFDTEFDAIETAIATKADASSGSLTSVNMVTPEIQSGDTLYDYIFAVSTLTADRTITLPLLTGNDTFVFEAHAATLTNKTIDLGNNTLTGSTTEFDTALQSDTFLFGSDLIDDDTFATATATNIPSAESVKAYVDANGGGAGTVDTSGTPVALDFARFTDANTIEGRSYAEVKADLSLEIGTDVQAYDAGLADIAGLAVTDGNIIVGDGANWVAESGATARTSLGLAIGTDVQAYNAVLTTVTSYTGDATELNVLDGATAGTGVASKALVLDSNGDITTPGEFKATSYNETYTTFTSSTNACSIDCEAGNDFQHTLTENTTLTINNPPASGTSYTMFVRIIQDAGASGYTFTWDTEVDWPGGTAPTLSTGASDVDIFVLNTKDGGTTWSGQTFGLNIA
jgi:hypothetical protein